MFNTERALVRAGTLSASPGGGPVVTRAWCRTRPARSWLLNDQHPALRYPMDPAVWLREACAVAGRDLSPTEWDRYLPGRACAADLHATWAEGRPPPPPAGRQGAAARILRRQHSERGTRTAAYPCETNRRAARGCCAGQGDDPHAAA